MCRSVGWLVPVLVLLCATPAHPGGLTFVEVDRDGVGGVDGIHGAAAVTVSPDGAHVYAAGHSEDAVAVLSRNPVTGALTPVEVQRDGVGGVDGLAQASDVAVSPDGAHVYVTGELDDGVAVFSRNGGSGALTFVEVQKDGVGGVDGLKRPTSVALSPDGAHVYVVGQDDDGVAVFSRNGGTGALTFVEAQKDGVGGVHDLHRPRAPVVTADGAHVYVAGEGSDSVVVFSRNAGTGALTFVEAQKNDVAGVTALHAPRDVAVSADGKTVYVASQNDNAVVAFSRNAGTGALAFLQFIRNDGETHGLNNASGVIVSPDDKYVYATGAGDSAIAVMRRNTTTGVLTYLEVQVDNVFPVDGLQGAAAVTVSADGASVYGAGREDNALAVFAADRCGNGTVGTDEQCDDGNLVGGDGCSATCRLELCAPTPAGGCRHSPTHRSKVSMTERTPTRHDKVDFQFKHGAATALAEFGDPTTNASYALCVYDGSGGSQPLLSFAAPAGGTCAGRPCWLAKPTQYRYKDRLRTPDGLDTVQLLQGTVDGRTTIKFLGKGSNLFLPTGLPFVPPLILQVRNTATGVCWEASFSTLATFPTTAGTKVIGFSD